MKMPRKAPALMSLYEIFQTQPPAKLSKLVLDATASHQDGKYIHWDNLLHRAPPEGYTHKEWWFGIKLHRRSLSRKIPFKDKFQAEFKFIVSDKTQQILHEIDLGAGGQIGIPHEVINSETKDQYYISSLIQEAITSSQLEGATTTRAVAKKMIQEGRVPSDRSEQMILNNFMTMREIGKVKRESLTPDLICRLHSMVTSGTLNNPNAAGRLRGIEEKVNVEDMEGNILHEPPPASELPSRMQEMCDFANGKLPGPFVHPVIRSIILHFWLGYDHPFVDGNGRTARALFYWSMLNQNYWLFEFISISQIILAGPSKYGRAFLYTETDENDLTYFIDYHLNVIQRAVRVLHAYIERKAKEVRELQLKLKKLDELNPRQRQLIAHALRHPRFQYSIESHQTSHNVVYQTARTDLLDLEKRGLLEVEKGKRRLYFRPSSGLEEKLKQTN